MFLVTRNGRGFKCSFSFSFQSNILSIRHIQHLLSFSRAQHLYAALTQLVDNSITQHLFAMARILHNISFMLTRLHFLLGRLHFLLCHKRSITRFLVCSISLLAHCPQHRVRLHRLTLLDTLSRCGRRRHGSLRRVMFRHVVLYLDFPFLFHVFLVLQSLLEFTLQIR